MHLCISNVEYIYLKYIQSVYYTIVEKVERSEEKENNVRIIKSDAKMIRM